MKNSITFALNCSGYSVKLLTKEDAAVLQTLYEQCSEFAVLTYGKAFAANAAREEFDDLPDGKTTQDIYIFGLFDSCNELIGMISSVRLYPNNQTWWLGLMMLNPLQRRQKIGSQFYQAFENWVLAQGVSQVSLCAIEANETGLKFWKSLGFEIIRKIEPRKYGNKMHAVYVLSRAVKTKV